MGFIFLILGIVNTYRAIVSLRLTCLPSSDSLSRKIAIVRSLQEKFEWTLTNGRNGSFEFYDKRGLNPRVITFICKEDAYYYNCMVHAFRAGSGVSITQTLQVAKAIKALTAKSGNIQISGRLTSRSS